MPENLEPEPDTPDVEESAAQSVAEDVGSGSDAAISTPESVPGGDIVASVGASASAGGDQFTSVRDHIRQLGYGQLADQHPDDAQLVAHLLQQQAQAQQSLALAQYGQRYLQYAPDIERFLQERQQQQQAAQQQKSKWWNPPEWNPSWRGLVTKDDQGNLVAVPGAPPDVVPKVAAYDAYRREFADKLLSNPEETLKPFVQDVAQQIAQEMLTQNLGQLQEHTYAQNFVQQHSSWLHSRDASGNVLRDPVTGRPALSEAGRAFRDYVAEAEQLGIRGVSSQEQYAARLLRADLLSQQSQQQSSQVVAQTTNEQKKKAFVRKPNPAASVTMAESLNGYSPGQSTERISLGKALAAEGVTDADIL